MDVTFRTNASTGIWHDIGGYYNVPGDNTYTVVPTDMNSVNTRYWWSVNAKDTVSGKSTNKTFSFTTIYVPLAPWWNSSWTHRKQITIDHTLVQAGLTNFPVLINFASDNDLKAYAQPNGNDIVFATVSGTKLNHEIEVYNSGTGQLTAWVNIPSLSSTVDTTLYLYYGNSACGNQQNPHSTWNSNYLMVQHMNNAGNIIDSTVNHLNGTNSGTTADTGKIDGCRYFDSTSDRYDFGTNAALNPGMNSRTISFWTKVSDAGTSITLIKYANSNEFDLNMYNNNAFFRVYDGTNEAYRYWGTQWRDGAWHLLTMVINRNTNQLDVYLDGYYQLSEFAVIWWE